MARISGVALALLMASFAAPALGQTPAGPAQKTPPTSKTTKLAPATVAPATPGVATTNLPASATTGVPKTAAPATPKVALPAQVDVEVDKVVRPNC